MNIPFEMTEIKSRPDEGVSDLATAAEEARAADHGRRDSVDQQRAAAGVGVDAVEARREHDAAETRHGARDHEDEDADASDVDPGPPCGFRVPAHCIHVASERRPLGDERPHDQRGDDEQQRERHSRGPCSGS